MHAKPKAWRPRPKLKVLSHVDTQETSPSPHPSQSVDRGSSPGPPKTAACLSPFLSFPSFFSLSVPLPRKERPPGTEQVLQGTPPRMFASRSGFPPQEGGKKKQKTKQTKTKTKKTQKNVGGCLRGRRKRAYHQLLDKWPIRRVRPPRP